MQPARLAFILLATLLVKSSMAATPIGGLAVAATPDGATVVAAGDSRTLYVLDQALAVKERIWLGSTVIGMWFSADGTTLLVLDTDDTVRWLATGTWKTVREERGLEFCSVAPAAGRLAGRKQQTVRVLSIADAATIKEIALPKDFNVAGLGLSGDGKRLAIWSQGVKDPAVTADYNTPKDLRGMDSERWRQEHDGYNSIVLVNAVDGADQTRHTIALTPMGNTTVAFRGDDVLLMCYGNLNGVLAPDGALQWFQLGNGYNYGLSVSPDRALIASGGLRDFTLTTAVDLKQVTGQIDKLPGWPEYFKFFAFSKKGIHGSTTAWRVVHIGNDGKVIVSVPVY